ncbi:MAG: GTP pyrophosphokinase [Clostridia bacterium]
MVNSEFVTKILNFIYDAHKGQFDKSGAPYVFHPFFLATQMDDENSVVLALLHDVVEDTDKTFDDIKALGVNDDVIAALKLLTHNLAVPYFEYVNKIKENKLATKVKLADLKHNSDLSRLKCPTQKDVERVAKYAASIKILSAK